MVWFGFGLVSFKSYVSKITGMKAFLSDLDNNDGTTDSGIYKPQLLNLILGYLHAGARVQVLKNRSSAFCHSQTTLCYRVPHSPYLCSLLLNIVSATIREENQIPAPTQPYGVGRLRKYSTLKFKHISAYILTDMSFFWLRLSGKPCKCLSVRL